MTPLLWIVEIADDEGASQRRVVLARLPHEAMEAVIEDLNIGREDLDLVSVKRHETEIDIIAWRPAS